MVLGVKLGELYDTAHQLSEEDLEYLVYKRELLRRREMRARAF